MGFLPYESSKGGTGSDPPSMQGLPSLVGRETASAGGLRKSAIFSTIQRSPTSWQCRGDSGVLGDARTRIQFLHTGGQERPNCPSYDSSSYGCRGGRQGSSAPVDHHSGQGSLTLHRIRVHLCARKLYSPFRYCTSSVVLISPHICVCTLYITNPPRSYVYAITEFIDCPGRCRTLNLRPEHPSTSSTASVTGPRKCLPTSNRVGKYGCLPSVTSCA